MRKTLGVLGGVGPLSTAYFMERLIELTDAAEDQAHLDMIVFNHCEIPDRTAYILDPRQPNPIPMMREDAMKLEELGCAVIACPCNTAHYFFEELQQAVKIPVINMIDETALTLHREGAKKVGIMATRGTVHTGLFQTALERYGMEAVLPSPAQQEQVMALIYDYVKAGIPADPAIFEGIVTELKAAGCDRIILGCTELSLFKKEYHLDNFYLDALEVLCIRSIEACGLQVKKNG